MTGRGGRGDRMDQAGRSGVRAGAGAGPWPSAGSGQPAGSGPADEAAAQDAAAVIEHAGLAGGRQRRLVEPHHAVLLDRRRPRAISPETWRSATSAARLLTRHTSDGAARMRKAGKVAKRLRRKVAFA